MFPDAPFSDRSGGATVAPFLKFPSGARIEAMGGASAASTRGCESVFYNPAGTLTGPKEPRSDIGLGYSNLISGAQAGSAAYSRSLGGAGTVSAGLVYFIHGGQTAYDSRGEPVGEFSPSDFSLTGAYAHGFGRGIRVGAGLKVIRSSLQNDSGATAAVDLGAQVLRVVDLGDGPLDLGASVSNLGMPMKLGGVSQPLPMRMSVGVVWRVNPMLHVAMDGHLPVDDDPFMSLGVEFVAGLGKAGKGAVRTGFNQAATRGVDRLSGVTVGGGLDFTRMRFDYAWAPYGDLGHTNRANLGLRF